MAYPSKETALTVLRFCHSKGVEGHLKTLTRPPDSQFHIDDDSPAELFGVQFDWPLKWGQPDIDNFFAEVYKDLGWDDESQGSST